MPGFPFSPQFVLPGRLFRDATDPGYWEDLAEEDDSYCPQCGEQYCTCEDEDSDEPSE